MARTIPAPPAPAAAIADKDGKPTQEWVAFFNELYNALVNRIGVTGSVTFAASTTATVTFTTPEADANYSVMFDPVDSTRYWATSRTTTGFTANANVSNSNTVRYMLVRS